MNTLFKKAEGARGESIACDYLRKKGYTIVEKNFLIRGGELDIVALNPQKDTLVFVEVKTRSSEDFGTPFESITPWKLKSLIKTAHVYKLSHAKLPDAMRIDAISVKLTFSGDVQEIDHIENITE